MAQQDERFGVLVGVTQQKRTTRTMEASTEDYQWYGNGTTARDASGNLLEQDGIHYWWGQSGFNNQAGKNYSEFFMPTSVNFAVKEEKRERKGGQLTFQFKPVDNVTMTANYFRFELQGYTQNMLKVPEWNLARYNRTATGPAAACSTAWISTRVAASSRVRSTRSWPERPITAVRKKQAAAGLEPGGWGPTTAPQLTGGYSKERHCRRPPT